MMNKQPLFQWGGCLGESSSSSFDYDHGRPLTISCGATAATEEHADVGASAGKGSGAGAGTSNGHSHSGGGGSRTLTSIRSQEELERYAATQQLLEQAQTVEEASEVSHLTHSQSIEALAALGKTLEQEHTSTVDAEENARGSCHEQDNTKLNSCSQISESVLNAKKGDCIGNGEKRRGVFRSKKKKGKILERLGNAFKTKVKEVESALFPHRPQMGSSTIRHLSPDGTTKKDGTDNVVNGALTTASSSLPTKVRGGVRLNGCSTDNEHKQVVRQSIAIMKQLKGEDGLQAMGFAYRRFPIHDQAPSRVEDTTISNANNNSKSTVSGSEVPDLTQAEEDEVTAASAGSDQSETIEFMNRLCHIETNSIITMKNRKEFIADGDMYDQVARLAQEYAQELMCSEGNLKWITICEAGNNPEPIRALVSSAIYDGDVALDQSPTLLIATGKGKVRAGIFSRQHILTSGLECSTALPIVRDARKRGMNCVLVDPNVHGDRLGMPTFEKSMARIFQRWESNKITAPTDRPPFEHRDLFVLSHSQSGAQFARYLLERSQFYVPHIRAVAFTDSTHNIQWTRKKKDLHQLLQSERCIYFRGSKESQQEVLKPLPTTGEIVETDSFWEHRFGRIETRCAGTPEHGLTNWFVYNLIWDHFDRFSHQKVDQSICQTN